jgi:uncharacterized membrane protein YtjA (UPF0391 family)
MSDTEPDRLGVAALSAAMISLVGFLVLSIGHAVDPHLFHPGNPPTVANNVAFFAFIVGLLIALFLGAALTLHHRRVGRNVRRTPATVALVYGVVFLLVAVVAAALGF